MSSEFYSGEFVLLDYLNDNVSLLGQIRVPFERVFQREKLAALVQENGFPVSKTQKYRSAKRRK